MAEDKENEEGSERPKFVVKDNRRFDSEGNERASDSSAKSEDKKTSEPAPTEESPSSGFDSQGGPAPEINFSSFLMSLATQALMQLGEIPSPDGFDVQFDVAAAKQTIDIISLVKDKTVGNLSPEEQRLMEEILHNLRLSFVRRRGEGK